MNAAETLRLALMTGSTTTPNLDQIGAIEELLVTMPALMQEDECVQELQLLCRSVDERSELMLDIINGDYAPLEIV